jgi:hypothetical protein
MAKVINVYGTLAELDQAVSDARRAGGKPEKTRRFRVNGAFVMASDAAQALYRAFLAEAPGIELDELEALPSTDAIAAAIPTLSEDEKEAIRRILAKKK